MLPIAVIFAITDAGYGVAAAGLAGGANALGGAITGPIQGRLIDRRGARKVLAPLALCSIATTGLLFWSLAVSAPAEYLILFGFTSGLFRPYIASVLRGTWWRLLSSDRERNAALAFEAGIAQAATLLAPLMVAGGLFFGAPEILIAFCALMGGVGTLIVTSVDSPPPISPTAGEPQGGTLLNPLVLATLLSYTAFYATVGFIEVWLSTTGGSGPTLALSVTSLSLLAAFQIGASLWYGTRQRQPDAHRDLVLFLLLSVIPLLPLLFLLPSAFVVIVSLAAFGFTRGPISPLVFGIVALNAPQKRVTEALAWVGVTTMAGPAIGRTLGGVLMSHHPIRGIVAAICSALVACVLAWLAQRLAVRGAIRQRESGL